MIAHIEYRFKAWLSRRAPAMLSALTDRGLVRRSRPDDLKRGYVYFPVTRRAA